MEISYLLNRDIQSRDTTATRSCVFRSETRNESISSTRLPLFSSELLYHGSRGKPLATVLLEPNMQKLFGNVSETILQGTREIVSERYPNLMEFE